MQGLAADAHDARFCGKGLVADARDGGPEAGLAQKASQLMLMMLALRKGLAADARDAGPERYGPKRLTADAHDAGSEAGLAQKGSRLMLMMLALRPVWTTADARDASPEVWTTAEADDAGPEAGLA